eukprot:TRINITY_DN50883_c0_g1_i1.p1 TRINITY_DN50883_c0_g1~~TRINITY_DN50883_c0_g1_i1.p1  ORF type:complete len:174 (+),score=27.40 TRINITY_DN50883_c0_g1_i1:96-617(+)
MALIRDADIELETSLGTAVDIQSGWKDGRRRAMLAVSSLFLAAAAVVAVVASSETAQGSARPRSLLVYTVCKGGESPNDCDICMPDSSGGLPGGCTEATHSCACVEGSVTTPFGCKSSCQRASSFTTCYYGIGDQQPADQPLDALAGGIVSCTEQLLSGIYLATLGQLMNYIF